MTYEEYLKILMSPRKQRDPDFDYSDEDRETTEDIFGGEQ